MKAPRLIAKYFCGIAAFAWAVSFAAQWVLAPVPQWVTTLGFVAFGIFMAAFMAAWLVMFVGGGFARDAQADSRAAEREDDPREDRDRPALLFPVWWFGLTLMAWGGLRMIFPLEDLELRDLLFDGRVAAELFGAIAAGWVAARLLFAAADRGWIS